MFPDINAGPDLVFLLQKQFTGSTRHSVRQSRLVGQVNKLVIVSQVSPLLATFPRQIETKCSYTL